MRDEKPIVNPRPNCESTPAEVGFTPPEVVAEPASLSVLGHAREVGSFVAGLFRETRPEDIIRGMSNQL